MEEKKEIKVVTGDTSNLDISPVYEHLNVAKPQPSSKKPRNIVIPKAKKEKEKKKNNRVEDNT